MVTGSPRLQLLGAQDLSPLIWINGVRNSVMPLVSKADHAREEILRWAF